jgi:prepilin-type N-terminal cleavage/methylation domain-containing protein
MFVGIRSEAGFTIVEVIIAAVVLAIGLMSAAAMQTSAVTGANDANRMTERVTAAELSMEDLMNRPIVDTDPDYDTIFDNATGELEDAPTCSEYQTHRTRYRMVANAPLNNLMTMQVLVTPKGLTEGQINKKLITFSYIRSTRFN